MVPLTSDLKETPSSTGPSGPPSRVAGTAVAGQIVCWALATAKQARTRASASRADPAPRHSLFNFERVSPTSRHTNAFAWICTVFSDFKQLRAGARGLHEVAALVWPGVQARIIASSLFSEA